MKLVENWREAPRWLSVKCMAIAAALQGAWLVMDAEQRASLPPGAVTALTIVLLVLGTLGRVVDQTKPDANPEDGHAIDAPK